MIRFFSMIYIIGKKRMTLLNKIVSSSINENKINKRLDDYAYKANIKAKRIKSDVREPKESIHGKPSSLLNKIVKSSINENKAEQRLQQIAYAAINGQRQQENQTPEGITMLGQLNREKPLSAISKEMIKEYQEEQDKPLMIDGEARKYMKADYEPILKIPINMEDLKDEMRAMNRNKMATAYAIKDIDNTIKDLNDYYKGFIRDINIFGMNIAKRDEKIKLEKDMQDLLRKREILVKNLDEYDYGIKKGMEEAKNIKRENALIPEYNKQEVKKYEQSLLQLNRNRLNLQQQPYESEFDYYKRLKEVETSKYDPTLYKKYASNQTTKELKPKLKSLFNDDSFIENILKSMNDEYKFMINKNFDNIKTEFINKNGFNPNMNVETATKEIISIIDKPSSSLQALFKRKKQQDLIIPDIRAKQEEAKQKEALDTLQGVFKRKKIEPKFSKVLNKYRDMKEEEQTSRELGKQQARERQQEKMNELTTKKTAQSRLSSALIRSNIQPAMREIIKEIKTEAEEKAARKKEKTYLRNQELYLRDIEQRLPILESWLERHQDIQDAAIIPQRELINREILANKAAAINIQKVLRGYKGRQQAKQRTQAERQEIENAERIASQIREAATEQRQAKQAATNIQRVMRGYKGRREFDKELSNIVDLEMEQQMQDLSNELEELSIAPTSLAELDFINKEKAKLRKIRSDKGVKRSPYNTKMLKSIDAAIEYAKQKRADKLVEMSMQAAASREPISPSSQVIQTLPNPVGRPKKKRNPRGRPPKGKDTEGAAGSGLKRVKPPKRQVRTNKEELMKNRLRLVASQIEAGNTNPRLIKEVNELYKKLYDIDNAYMLLKK